MILYWSEFLWLLIATIAPPAAVTATTSKAAQKSGGIGTILENFRSDGISKATSPHFSPCFSVGACRRAADDK